MEVPGNNRVRVKELVSLVPGVHLRELQRLLGLSFNSTRYHVNGLIKTGEIVRLEDGGYSRLYPAGTSESEKTVFAIIRGKTDRKILNNLASLPKVSNKQLCELTNLAKSTVSEHLSNLVKLGIVRPQQISEVGLVYELAQPEEVKLVLRSQNLSILKKASARFTDLWDF